jgi:ABC-type hemin transport system ATPase subunit
VAANEPREVYFEFVSIGTSVKVVAIDAATGTEVSVIGPVGAAQSDLQRLALGKLKARLAREAPKPQI